VYVNFRPVPFLVNSFCFSLFLPLLTRHFSCFHFIRVKGRSLSVTAIRHSWSAGACSACARRDWRCEGPSVAAKLRVLRRQATSVGTWQCAWCSLQWGECSIRPLLCVSPDVPHSASCSVPIFQAVRCLRHFGTQDTVAYLLLLGF
jgi:hypothetical protein